MRKVTMIVTLAVVFSWSVLMGQNAAPISSSEGNTVTAVNLSEHDFINQYELSGKVPTTMRLTEEFTMHVAPDCSSATTSVSIPADSIVDAYKYFPDSQCWAVKYQGKWGFVSGTKVFPASKRTLNLNKYDVAPRLIGRIKPKYPKSAEEAGIAGTVSLKVFIDENGNVTKTKIVDGIPELNDAAIRAIKKAKFKPAVYRNKNVGVWIPISFDFE